MCQIKNSEEGSNNSKRNNATREIVSIMDGIAILLVLLNHSHSPLFSSWAYVAGPALYWLTASSGFKLTFNHIDKFDDKLFMRTYLRKRFVRLCKPYIGYQLLVLPPLLALVFIFDFLNISSSFSDTFGPFKEFVTSSPTEILYASLLGDPIVPEHLWYLYTLLVITVGN